MASGTSALRRVRTAGRRPRRREARRDTQWGRRYVARLYVPAVQRTKISCDSWSANGRHATRRRPSDPPTRAPGSRGAYAYIGWYRSEALAAAAHDHAALCFLGDDALLNVRYAAALSRCVKLPATPAAARR